MIRARSAGLSDVGLRRGHNEDCFDISAEHQAFVVADGMGGHCNGEVASRIAVATVLDFIEDTAGYHDTAWPLAYDGELRRQSNRLKSAIRIAHEEVVRAMDEDGELLGMGTTIVGFLVKNHVGALAHVGDSRAYRLRDARLELLTQDHTWVNEQVKAGYLSAEEAREHPLRNLITRALGGASDVLVDVCEIEVQSGDRFLFCSDGLTTMLTDGEIGEHVARAAPLDEICRDLVSDANRKGGHDNITVLVVDLEEVFDDGDETTVLMRPPSGMNAASARPSPLPG